jgi:hypothetical protein
LSWLPAQVDSAASRTVLPIRLVEELGLVQVDEIPIQGVGGHVTAMPTYLVGLKLRQLLPLTVEVVAHEGELFVLVGRDVLNHFRVILDGPREVLDID